MTEDEIDVEGEAALAMVQSTVQGAINRSGKTHAELEKALRYPEAYLKGFLQGDSQATVKQMGRILAACGFELNDIVIAPHGPCLPEGPCCDCERILKINDPEGMMLRLPGGIIPELICVACYKNQIRS